MLCARLAHELPVPLNLAHVKRYLHFRLKTNNLRDFLFLDRWKIHEPCKARLAGRRNNHVVFADTVLSQEATQTERYEFITFIRVDSAAGKNLAVFDIGEAQHLHVLPDKTKPKGLERIVTYLYRPYRPTIWSHVRLSPSNDSLLAPNFMLGVLLTNSFTLPERLTNTKV